MKKDVQSFVQNCLVCQQLKSPPTNPVGLLQPLPFPDQVWEDVLMDSHLPSLRGSTYTLVVVGRLTKYADFGPLTNHYSVSMEAKLFNPIIVKIHGFPRSII